MDLQTHGTKKYGSSTLLASSAGLGWSTILAELRSHGVYETPIIVPQHMELCVVLAGNDEGLIVRTGAGQRQEAKPTTGAVWLAPVGVGDNRAAITAPIPRTLHLYLPTTQFDRLGDDFNFPANPACSIRYAAGIHDSVIEQIGRSILSEMVSETSVGRMYVETASLMLAAHLIRSYRDSGSGTRGSFCAHALDHARLRRVFDYISAHLDDEIALVDLAKIAGTSLYHFARMFTLAVGVSPYRHISRMRLHRAMADIAAGKLPLAQIALDARFSSQASFTRAFRRATGKSPGEYRRERHAALT